MKNEKLLSELVVIKAMAEHGYDSNLNARIEALIKTVQEEIRQETALQNGVKKNTLKTVKDILKMAEDNNCPLLCKAFPCMVHGEQKYCFIDGFRALYLNNDLGYEHGNEADCNPLYLIPSEFRSIVEIDVLDLIMTCKIAKAHKQKKVNYKINDTWFNAFWMLSMIEALGTNFIALGKTYKHTAKMENENGEFGLICPCIPPKVE